MNNFFLKLGLTLLGSMMLLMLFSVAFSNSDVPVTAENSADYFYSEFCFEGGADVYTIGDLKRVYRTKTNDYFNISIKELMEDVDGPPPVVPKLSDYYSSPEKDICKVDDPDNVCKTIAICKDNISPYCVAINTLGFSPNKLYTFAETLEDVEELRARFPYLQYSFFCYHNALNNSKGDILKQTGQQIIRQCDEPTSVYYDHKICETKRECESRSDESKDRCEQSLSQLIAVEGYDTNLTGLNQSLANQAAQIDAEIDRSKKALDSTVDTYARLRESWKMHVKYVDIYLALVKYRDWLAEIRKQTDEYPLRFLNASTTKCK